MCDLEHPQSVHNTPARLLPKRRKRKQMTPVLRLYNDYHHILGHILNLLAFAFIAWCCQAPVNISDLLEP